ncbi:MAG: S-layer homology domain-containing protein [Oscillospiraceae bacterium]|nr:S-layer homology domain-containing protein [Oscillospiraceae bacterium]
MKQFLIGKRIGAGILSAAMALSLSTAALAASGDAVQTYSSDASVSGKTFTSTGTDENAILIADGTVTLDNITVPRQASTSTGGDDSSFYVVGAAILSTGGTTTITDSTITTDAAGGAGVFAYGDGVIHVSDTVISTAQDTSGGIHVAGGGTLYATDVTTTTQGESSAAIRSDRGGGLLVVSGGDYVSNGTGSPAVYCTATIVIEDADLTANSSEAVCIEGLNSLYLYDCNLTGSMRDSSQNDCTWNVILYQSMSGDSEPGNSTFQMVGGMLTAENGGMFYTTNTESTFILQDVTIEYTDDSKFFLQCTGNANQRGWGSTGSNGADCSFTAIEQEMFGDVLWDSISTLEFYMTDNSTLTGAFLQTTDYGTGSGYANLYIESGSKWIVTGNSVLTNLYNAGTIVDETGQTVTIKGADGTVYVKGSSSYTVTVSAYSATADLSAAATVTAYEDAQVNTGSQSSGSMGGQPGEMGGQPGGMGGQPGGRGGQPGEPDHQPGERQQIDPGDDGFTDVQENDWYYESIKYIREKGLMTGTGETTFSPNDEMNYAMAVVILARLNGQDTSGGSSWYEKGAEWAMEQELLEDFDPTASIPRLQFILMLWRYAGKPDSDYDLSDYSDFRSLSGDEATAMRWAVEQGLVSGTGSGELAPQDTMTRAQIAAILMRYCNMAER